MGQASRPSLGGPALVMENAEITEFSLTGTPRFTLQARTIAHRPSSGETALNGPILLLFSEQGRPGGSRPTGGSWTAAKRPTRTPDSAVANSDKVMLAGNVRAARPREDGSVLRFRTDTLSLFPAAQYAESAAPVMIESAEGITQAEGLSLALGVGFLTLGRANARVHSTFYPDSLP